MAVPAQAWAVGDAGTRFNVYVPPNGFHATRPSLMIVTNTSATTTTIDIEDDDADGDNDDSVSGISLARGQSYVLRIADGIVNDDAEGVHDGDYIRVSAEAPVSVQLATYSSWQHDWAVADGGGSTGRNFFIYAPPSAGAGVDLNVFAYHDDTDVTVRRISTTALTTTGTTVVDLANAPVVLEATLLHGEDLVVRENGLGLDLLEPGYSYWLQATQPVTAQYGHLGRATGSAQAREGAGFVPSANGSSMGSLFFFGVPHDPGREDDKELRIVCPDPVTVELFGATSESTGWTLIDSSVVVANGSLDYTGADDISFRDHDLYQLSVSPPHLGCTVFEGNRIEGGGGGMSDYASAVSSMSGQNLGHQFVTYVGPPARQGAGTNPVGEQTNLVDPVGRVASHLYIYAIEDATSVTVRDVDTGGAVFEELITIDGDEYFDMVIDQPTFSAMNQSGRRPYVEVLASQPVAVVGGNFSDDWMGHVHSVSPEVLHADLAVASDRLACNDTVDLTVDCALSDGSLDDLSISLQLPERVVYDGGTASLGTPSVEDGLLVWSAVPPPEGETQTLTLSVNVDCTASACLPPEYEPFPVLPSCEAVCLGQNLQSITATCSGHDGGELVADIATRNIETHNDGQPEITAFEVFDDSGLGEVMPAVSVSFSVDGGSGARIHVMRSVGEPNASPTEVGNFLIEEGGMTDFEVSDSYPQHYEEMRFYWLEIETVTGCPSHEGPHAVLTSSGSSGGAQSGLESNGRLAWKLARRAVARSDREGWLLPETLAQLEDSAGVREAELLSELLPSQGPSASVPVNVTPGDLPGLTNAMAVASADYVDATGERVASALVLETRGELYEHSKPLCDRAGGSRIDQIDHVVTADGALLRAAYANERDATGEYAIEVRLYEQPDGTFELVGQWPASWLPPPEPEQRVLTVQTWSTRAGLDEVLLGQILAPLDVQWSTPPSPPSAYLARAAVMGQRVAGELVDDGRRSGLSLRAEVHREDRTTEVMEFIMPPAGELELELDLDVGVSTEVNLAVLDAREEVVDRVWISDGAWTVLDDSMWGGATTVHGTMDEACPARPAVEPSELPLSGCARIEAEVEQFAGVARHIGGGLAPLDAEPYRAMRVWIESSQPVRACLERVDGEGADHPCVRLPAYPEGQWVTVDLESASRLDTCESVPREAVHLVSFTADAPGALELAVGGLSLLTSAVDDDALMPCGPVLDSQEAEVGCGCRSRGGRSTGWWWLLVCVGMALTHRRRRRTSIRRRG